MNLAMDLAMDLHGLPPLEKALPRRSIESDAPVKRARRGAGPSPF
ncbi:hypothetical protein AKJ09_11215 [Labilithrix luteola]|uniref:Uncharacterized protein n=1 Tax=Labilithrix luteola TaxID=1391654 RepID=A0A0K1QFW4_9BACT|nr:hypothetical protein AKJ09_11215 [Labilithrix luteola]